MLELFFFDKYVEIVESVKVKMTRGLITGYLEKNRSEEFTF